MPYPKKLLNDYEELAVDLHPHWWYFAEAVFALVGRDRRSASSLVAVGRRSWRASGLALVADRRLRALWLLRALPASG